MAAPEQKEMSLAPKHIASGLQNAQTVVLQSDSNQSKWSRLYGPNGEVVRGLELPDPLPRVVLGPNGEIVWAPERNVFPDFTPVSPGLKNVASDEAARLSQQLGIPIRADRMLEAPWIGRIYNKKGESTSQSSSEGWERNASRFWSEYQRQFPDDFKLLNADGTISVEFAKKMGWPTEGPNSVVGDKMEHHHVSNGTLVAAVPTKLHEIKSGNIHRKVGIATNSLTSDSKSQPDSSSEGLPKKKNVKKQPMPHTVVAPSAPPTPAAPTPAPLGSVHASPISSVKSLLIPKKSPAVSALGGSKIGTPPDLGSTGVVNADVRMRVLESKLASIGRVLGTALSIGSEVLDVADAIRGGLEANSMMNRAIRTGGKVYTEYFEMALQLEQKAHALAESYEAYHMQLTDLHQVILQSYSDRWERGLISERISRWLVDFSALKEEVEVTVKKVDEAAQLIPKQKELFERMRKDHGLAGLFGIASVRETPLTSLPLANVIFFIAEADDIKIALHKASKNFHSVLNVITEDIEFLDAWYRF